MNLRAIMLCLALACLDTPAQATPPERRVAKRQDPSLATLRQLQRVVPKADFSQERLEDVLQWFRGQGIRNIFVEWQVIEAVGTADPDTEVSIELYDMPLSDLLNWVLRQVSQNAPPGDELVWQVESGVLRLTTRSALSSSLVVRIYDIEALAQNLVLFDDAPFIAIDGGANQSGGSSGNSGGGDSRPIVEAGNSGDEVDFKENRTFSISQLVDAITSIEPTSWLQNGGDGTISVFNGKLVVQQTLDVHQRIGGVTRNR